MYEVTEVYIEPYFLDIDGDRSPNTIARYIISLIKGTTYVECPKRRDSRLCTWRH